MRAFGGTLIAALVPAVCSGATHAADAAFPSRPLRMVVPFAPGGGYDIIGRLVSQKLSDALGQPVVVDNRPGASANIGAAVVATAPADGYTLLLGNANFTINPGLFRKMPFDPVKDFAPVSLLANAINVLAVHPAVPANTVKQLIGVAKVRHLRAMQALELIF